ncbi:MAG: DUF2330 domain-containing protein [Candidatus Eisenbacteria bacterium]
MAPLHWIVNESAQEALIHYDAASQVENLILHVQFQGDGRDFAWLVPVPALPELEAAEVFLFRDCWSLTYPISRHRRDGLGCGSEEDFGDPVPQENGVDIYNEQVVGIYQTLTLGASDAGLLADSLEAWGYLHENNRVETEAALQYYIDKAWYFVAMRVDSASVVERESDGVWWWYGDMQPIRLSFASEEIVYPMRISAISALEEVPLTLYVCARHRLTFPRATTEYANRFREEELREAQLSHPYLAPFLAEDCFLTKLSATFTPSDMDEDLVLEPAGDDREFRSIHYRSGLTDCGLLPCGLVAGGFFLTGWRRRRTALAPGPD